MSIIIKDMVMPSACRLCGFNDYCYCTIRGLYVDGTATHGRADFCPLVELPEKHGDLIDRGALWNDLETLYERRDGRVNWNYALVRIKTAPIIVEAEGECG